MGSAHAYVSSPYTAVDTNGDPFTPLAASPNSSSAARDFKDALMNSGLVDVIGSDDLETQALGAPPGGELALTLGKAGTATLKASTGVIANVANGDTNGFGRYSVPGGTKFWDTQAGSLGSFDILFDRDMAGFGFYGIDIGDLSGSLSLVMFDANDNEISRLTVPTASPATAADGSVLYFGLIAQNSKEFFRRISFVTSSNLVDGFGFDSFTIGSAVTTPPGTIPEPATLLLVASAALGLRIAQRRRA